jgi:hypothetical protein
MVPSGEDRIYLPGVSLLTIMGRTAELARDRNRRMVFVLFNTNNFDFMRHWDSSGAHVDTGITRIPEASELRCLANLALAYSARGLIHQITSSAANVLEMTDTPEGGVWTGGNDSWALGPGVLDEYDYFAEFPVFERSRSSSFAGPQRYVVNDFYTGWGARTRETQRLNRWIRDSIGPELMKLRWRDAYSINFTVPQTWARRYSWQDRNGRWHNRWDSVGHRPIARGEIIEQVTTTRPEAAKPDPPEATYVEVGLFYPRTDTLALRRRLAATSTAHHLFLVNRRCFEPGDDLWRSASPTDSLRAVARRDSMVALAETRTISVRLNIPGGGSRVRVREIGTDTSRLPGAHVPRRPLDTIVASDGIVNITLGPGRAALLRISTLPGALGALPERGAASSKTRRHDRHGDATATRRHDRRGGVTTTRRHDVRRGVPITGLSSRSRPRRGISRAPRCGAREMPPRRLVGMTGAEV